ncbi:MAG: type I secretion system permease/ATPase [Mesorhizobium sp.]|nr:MAG: type I secretion system permease/ATPase [Mesorhizobium sp.]
MSHERSQIMKSTQGRSPDLRSALFGSMHGLVGVGVFSAVINVLALTGSVYMLQIYDRVLPSQSIPTLIGFTIGMLGLYAVYGLLDFVRLRLLVRIGSRLHRDLQQKAFAASLSLPLTAGQDANRVQPLRDLDQLRGFLSGLGPTVVFDAPWIPFYMVVIYLLHPSLGVLATLGAAAVVLLTVVAEVVARKPAARASETLVAQRLLADSGRRNAEVVQAMGLSAQLGRRWNEISHLYLKNQEQLSDVVGAASSLSKTLRMALQSSVLGLGAYLVIGGEASPGVIIASSILLGRSLAPVDVAIANWRGFLATRRSYTDLAAALDAFGSQKDPMELPRPQTQLAVEELTVAPPSLQRPTLVNVSFRLSRGAGLAIVGPSGSGKTTLVRALVGAWKPLRGTVRLDGASLDQWNSELLGTHIGYLPQDVELFDGTIADNISRFGGKSDAKGVLAAAKAAGVDKMIMRLPEGFQTRIGAILSVRERGGIAIVVAHRPSALVNIDQVLVLSNGMLHSFGLREDVLANVVRPFPRQNSVVPLQQGASGHA